MTDTDTTKQRLEALMDAMARSQPGVPQKEKVKPTHGQGYVTPYERKGGCRACAIGGLLAARLMGAGTGLGREGYFAYEGVIISDELEDLFTPFTLQAIEFLYEGFSVLWSEEDDRELFEHCQEVLGYTIKDLSPRESYLFALGACHKDDGVFTHESLKKYATWTLPEKKLLIGDYETRAQLAAAKWHVTTPTPSKGT